MKLLERLRDMVKETCVTTDDRLTKEQLETEIEIAAKYGTYYSYAARQMEYKVLTGNYYEHKNS